jgi:hypothetical protein
MSGSDAGNPDPIVSVIIATYNRSGVLRYAIESVLRQTLTDFELLVVGDGCTDDTATVVASFADPRIHWQNLPVNSGNQSAPNNAGLDMARGRYVAYLGHDDIWLSDHLVRHVEVLERTGADLTYSWMEMLGPGPQPVRQVTGISASGQYDGEGVLPPSSIVHTRAMATAIGPWKDYRTIARPPDQEFVARAFAHGAKFAPVRRLTVLKFNASWRPRSYEEKPVHEQADAMRRVRESSDFLADELHTVIETLVRAHPDDMPRVMPPLPPGAQLGALIENTRRLRGVEAKVLAPIARPERFPPLPDRLDLSVAAADPWLFSGWSWAEPQFRWTEGPEASLVFGMDRAADLEMQLLVAPYLIPRKVKTQNVVVSCNGKEVTRFRLASPDMALHSVRLPASHLRLENVITFGLPNAAIPMSLGESLDSRRLGIRVAWIEFRNLQTRMPREASPTESQSIPDFEVALAANRQAMANFLTTARSVANERWAEPIAPGKWSSAQIADHVAVAYEVAVRALKGEAGIRSAPRLLRPVVRAVAFTGILRKGAFPEKSKGPRVFAPSSGHPGFETTAARMETAVASLESQVRSMQSAARHTFEHPIFGRIGVADYVKFSELHAKHHEQQLRAAARR